jgi:hypothetical protein
MLMNKSVFNGALTIVATFAEKGEVKPSIFSGMVDGFV